MFSGIATGTIKEESYFAIFHGSIKLFWSDYILPAIIEEVYDDFVEKIK